MLQAADSTGNIPVEVRARFALVAIAGLAAGVGACWLAAHSSNSRPTEPGVALTVIVGASLFVSGLLSWRRRPDSRLGPLMIATGFAWFVSLLIEAHTPWLYTFGGALQFLWITGFFAIILSFPSGHFNRLDRLFVGSVLALGVGFQLVAMLFGGHRGLRCSDCPKNALRVFFNDTLARDILDAQRLLAGLLVVAVLSLLIVRWRRASGPRRRAAEPVLPAGVVALAALLATILNDVTGDTLGRVPSQVFFYTFAAVPVAVLVVFLRRRLDRGIVADLVVELGEQTGATELRGALAKALGDPALELAFWLPAERRYVDADGRPVLLPEDERQRRATIVERNSQPVAAVIHDPALDHNAELVQSVCAAAALALENERLHAELRAQLAELRASRGRLVEATDAERRRIERDLHDGTQQRLVSIAMSLGLLESKLPTGSSEARPLIRETRQALALALAELRDLTQGIHPTLLAERGLPVALDELCRRAALPVQLDLQLDSRLPGQVESAAYFFTSEALANAAKHSHAHSVRVHASTDGRTLTVEIADDGIGGAATGGGSGLRGLIDRVEALGGRMTISSPPGRGTTLSAEIPCV